MKIDFKDLVPQDELGRELVDSLRKSRPLVNKFVVSMLRQRRLVVNVNPNLAESSTQIYDDPEVNKINYKIIVGTDRKNFGILERRYFDSNKFTDQELLEYKLLQQICLCIYNELTVKNNPSLKSFNTLAINQNTADKRFYTLYGSYNVSLNSEDLHKADISELLAMYLWDTNYFNKYMRFVIDQSSESLFFKKQYAVRPMTLTNVTILEEMVKNILKAI